MLYRQDLESFCDFLRKVFYICQILFGNKNCFYPGIFRSQKLFL